MPRKFTCDICAKNFTRKDNMRYHILEVHCNKKKKCKYCNKLMRSSSFKRHQKYACSERKKILKARKEAKKQNEAKQHHLIEDENPSQIFVNDPIIESIELFDISLLEEQTEFDLNEFLSFN